MSQLKLDFSKLFELQVLVIESDQDLLHLIRQMLLGLGIKNLSSSRNVDEVLSQSEKLPYDVIFLDYGADENKTGAEVVEQMILAGILPSRTRLVLLAAQNDRAKYAIEYPYHQVTYLERPFNKTHLDNELKQHVMFSHWLKPILSLAGLNRYADALKMLLHTQRQQVPAALTPVLTKLRVQLLLDLGQFDAIVPLLKAPLAEMQGWALWALFRFRYERGEIAACEAFLQDPSEEMAKYAERRELWQIYLAMQQQDYERAYQVASKIPNVGMSMNMVRLVHLVMVLAGKVDQAIEFIERKRRLSGKGNLFLQLSVAQARSLLYLLTINAEPLKQPVYKIQLKQLMQQMEDDRDVAQVHNNLVLLKTHLLCLDNQEEAARQLVAQHQTELAADKLNLSDLCHAAVVFAALHEMHNAVNYLYAANLQLHQMPDNSSRVFAGCLHRHAFDLIIDPSHRPATYAEMAKRLVHQDDLRLAAKMFYFAHRAEPGNNQYLQALEQLMRKLGINRFRTVVLSV